MNLRELAHQIYTLPYNLPCYINDEKRTSEKDVYNLMKNWLLVDHKKDVPSKFVIFEICLPDGRWFVRASRLGSYYDLYVPETRQQEQRIKDCLFNRNEVKQ